MLCCSNQNLTSNGESQRPLERSRSRSRSSRSRWSLFGRGESVEKVPTNSRETSPSRQKKSPLLRRLSRSPRRRERAASLPTSGRPKGSDRKEGRPASHSALSRSTVDTRPRSDESRPRSADTRPRSGKSRPRSAESRPRSASPSRRVDFTPETKGHGGQQGHQGQGYGGHRGQGQMDKVEAMRPPRLEGVSLAAPVTVRAGDSCQLTVEVGGIPIPDITWFHGSREIKNSADFRVDDKGTRCTLHIAAVTEQLSARGVRVVARNRVGVEERNVDLKVYTVLSRWQPQVRSESFSTTSPDTFLRRKRPRIRKVQSGLSMTSMQSLGRQGPPKPARSMSMGDNWSYSHASHSTDSILDEVFSFDRKAAFATSTPRDPKLDNTPSKQTSENLVRSAPPKTGSYGTYPRNRSSMRDSGYSENIFRFRSSDSNEKHIEVYKAPPLALPEEFDDSVSDISIHSPAPGEKLVTPTEPKEMLYTQDTSSVPHQVKPTSDTFNGSMRDSRRLSANGQIWISNKKISKSLSAVHNMGSEGTPADKKPMSANRQQWQSEEKVKRRSLGDMLESSRAALFIHDSPVKGQKQPLHSAVSTDEPDSASINKDIIQAIIRKKTATVPKRGRPVSETDLDDFASPIPYGDKENEIGKKDEIKPVSTSLTSKPPLPRPRKTDSGSPKQKGLSCDDPAVCLENNNNITKHTDISEVSFDTEKDTSVALLGFSGKQSSNGKSPQNNKNQVVTKAEVHLSMEGPSFHPDNSKDTPKNSDKLTSTEVSERLSRATKIQTNLESEKKDRNRSLSPHDRKWVYPASNGKKSSNRETPKSSKIPQRAKLKDTDQLPCVKVLDQAISYIYAEAFAQFGIDASDVPSPLAEKAKKNTEDKEVFSQMHEQPYVYQPGKPLPRLSEASEEGSEASFKPNKENISNNNSGPDILNGINTNSNNRHHTLSIGSIESAGDLDMDSLDVITLSNEVDQESLNGQNQMRGQEYDSISFPKTPKDICSESISATVSSGETQSKPPMSYSKDLAEEKILQQDSLESNGNTLPYPKDQSDSSNLREDANNDLQIIQNHDDPVSSVEMNESPTSLVCGNDLCSDLDETTNGEPKAEDSDSADSVDTVIEVKDETKTSIPDKEDDTLSRQQFIDTFVQHIMNSALEMFQVAENQESDHDCKEDDYQQQPATEQNPSESLQTKAFAFTNVQEPTELGHVPCQMSESNDSEKMTVDSDHQHDIAAEVLNKIQCWVDCIIKDAVTQIGLSESTSHEENALVTEQAMVKDPNDLEESALNQDTQGTCDSNELSQNETEMLNIEHSPGVQAKRSVEDRDHNGRESPHQVCTDPEYKEIQSIPVINISNADSDSGVNDNEPQPRPEERKEIKPEDHIDTWVQQIIENAIEIVQAQQTVKKEDTKSDEDSQSGLEDFLIDPICRTSSLSSISEESEASFVDETFQISEIPSTRPCPGDQESMITETFTQIDLPATSSHTREALDNGKEPKSEQQASSAQEPGSRNLIPAILKNAESGNRKNNDLNIDTGTVANVEEASPNNSTHHPVEVVEPLVRVEQNQALLTVPTSSTEPSERSVTDENSLDMSWDSDMGPELTFVTDTVPSVSPENKVKSTKPQPEVNPSNLKQDDTSSEKPIILSPKPVNLSTSPAPTGDRSEKTQKKTTQISNQETLDTSVTEIDDNLKISEALRVQPDYAAIYQEKAICRAKATSPTEEMVHSAPPLSQMLMMLVVENRGAVIFLLVAVAVMLGLSWWSSAED